MKYRLALLALSVCLPAYAAPQEFPAQLAAHTVPPAKTFIQTPKEAGSNFAVSGKFTAGKRVDAVGSIEGDSNGRPTGLHFPFKGQAVQGHSGIKVMPDKSVWLITDNGFGNKKNSIDSALFLRHYTIER